MSNTNRLAAMTRLIPRIVRPGTAPSVELVPGHLEIILVLEGTAGTRPVTYEDLERWDATIEELVPVARENLRRRTGSDGWFPVKSAPGLMIYEASDGEAASRMLLIDHLLQPTPIGGVIVAVPGEGQLMAVSLDEMDALESLRVLASASEVVAKNEGVPLSDQLFWWDGSGWHLLAVERDNNEIRVHPSSGFLTMLERLASMNYYAVAAEA